jgi:pyruvate dehydrogenase E1 component alpha subunit
VAVVFQATADAAERARHGGGPTLIEALTYRYFGHCTGQDNAYRTAAEIEEWQQTKDPILRLKQAMQKAGMLTETGYGELAAGARRAVEDAIAFAEESPWPEAAAATAGVTGLDLKMRVNPWQGR